jgi:hypothetical protein
VLESVHLSEAQLQNVCKGTCTLTLAALCLTSECDAVVYADQGSYLLLSDNQPYQATADTGYSYFRYAKTQEGPVTVLLTVLAGDPDLYVAQKAVPTKENATWASSTYGGETLVLNTPFTGILYIGVRCLARCEFTLIVLPNAQPITPLFSGLPQYTATARNSYSTFVFWSYSREDVEFKVTVMGGEVMILVNTQREETEEVYEKVPSLDRFTWSSEDVGNQQNRIRIRQNDENFCVDCNFVLAVYAKQDSEYIITAIHTQYMEMLLNGVPVYGIVSVGEINSYVFSLDTESDLEIRLAVYSGDPDVYVDTSVPVSSKFNKWKSSSISTEEVIEIPKGSQNWQLGNYYIAVDGWKTSAYSIVVHSKQSPILLTPGFSHIYSLDYPLRFWMKMNKGTSYTCSVTSLVEAVKPRVYIKFNHTADFPTPTKFDISYENDFDYDPIFNSLLFVLPSEEAYTASMLITRNMAVQSPFVSLLCIAPNVFTSISQHSYVAHTLVGKVARFSVIVTTEHELRITVQFCGRIGRVVVSDDPNGTHQLPSVGLFYYTDRVLGIVENPSGQYFITVFGEEGDSFELFTGTEPEFSMRAIGEIHYKVTKEGFTVEWPRAIINKGDAESDVVYYVYTARDNNSQLYSACGLRMNVKKGRAKQVSAQGKNLVEIKEKDEVYVNVVAIVGKYKNSAEGFATYQPIKLERRAEEVEGTSEWINWKGVVGFLVIVGVAAGAIYYKKRKEGQRRLGNSGYELSNF